MSYTENSILIVGDVKDIYNCVLKLERWPLFIPSIKHSKIIGQYQSKELHEMSSRIFGIKSSWQSYLLQAVPYKKIKYKQLKGLCKTMEGEWIFKEGPSSGIHVTLTHDFVFDYPIIGSVIEPIIKKYVIKISDNILKGIKAEIEGRS
jgi:ribosome-associated toxin RatA of RatAB toxin-antitoxin module